MTTPSLKTPTLIAVLLAGAMLSTSACTERSGAEREQTATDMQQGGPGEAAASTNGAAAAEASATEQVLQTYEEIRAQLAADDGQTAEDARTLARQAAEARTSAPDALRPHLTTIETEARKLADIPPTELDRIRRAFGEVSRGAVALVAAKPAFAEGLHVFQCPMADGYQRWVQSSPEIANPYMGQKMLACGTKVEPAAAE